MGPVTMMLAEILRREGGEPGSSLHSWRCEYPDRYGPCECVEETAAEQANALHAAGLLAPPVVVRLEALAKEADAGGDHPTAARIRAALYDDEDGEGEG